MVDASRSAAVLVVVALWGAAVVLFLVGRGSDTRSGAPTAAVPSSSQPRYLDVKLDSSGRPYDVAFPKGFEGKVVRRPLAVLHAPSRQVLFMGGEEALWVRSGEHTPVTLADLPGRRYRIDGIWMDSRNDRHDTTVGVVIVERETRIVRWREELSGYGTDAGLGAVTTVEWADEPKSEDNELSQRYWQVLIDEERPVVVADVDSHDGTDTVIFGNGYGDGGFPSVAGYDASGRRAAIVLWSAVVPWRLAFPVGKPPSQVTEREKELAACLAGKVRVYGYRCRVRQ